MNNRLSKDILYKIYKESNTITQLNMYKAFPLIFKEPLIFPLIKNIQLYENIKHKTSIIIKINEDKHYEIFTYGIGFPFSSRTHVFLVYMDNVIGEWFSYDYLYYKSIENKNVCSYETLI